MDAERQTGGPQVTSSTYYRSPLSNPALNIKTTQAVLGMIPEVTPSKVKRLEDLPNSLKVGKVALIKGLLMDVENGNSIKKQREIGLGMSGASLGGSAQQDARQALFETSPSNELTPAERRQDLRELSKDLDSLKGTLERMRQGSEKLKTHQEIINSKEYQEGTARLFTSGAFGVQARLAGNNDQPQKIKDQSFGIDPLQRFSTNANLLPTPPETPARPSNLDSSAHSALIKKQQETEKKLAEVIEQLETTQRRLLEEVEGKSQVIKDLEEKNRLIEQLKGTYQSEIVGLTQTVTQMKNEMKEKDESKNKHVKTISAYEEEVNVKTNMIELIKKELEKCDAQRMMNLAQLQELRGNLRIYCRLKPTGIHDERAVILRDKAAKEVMLNTDPSKKSKPVPFVFDHVFGEPCSQVEVFKEIEPFIQSTLDGKQISIFAYGPTGSGKTHTLEGQNDYGLDTVTFSSGIMPRSLSLIIEQVNMRNLVTPTDQQLDLYLSCLEIYNERLGDLLGPKDREDEVQILVNKGKVVLPDVVRKKITNMREALEAIKLSCERRQTEATAYNSRSSRSHSIYRIAICRRNTGEQLGLLNIIDMAAQKRIVKTLQILTQKRLLQI